MHKIKTLITLSNVDQRSNNSYHNVFKTVRNNQLYELKMNCASMLKDI